MTQDTMEQIRERAARHCQNYFYWLNNAKCERELTEAYDQYKSSLAELRSAEKRADR